MKTAIVFYSTHHGNTRRLAEAIQSRCGEVTLFDAARENEIALDGYDCIGFASGIAYGGFYAPMLKKMQTCLPPRKKVFFLYTCGSKRPGYTDAAAKTAAEKECEVLGEYGCLGFDTFGPFKLIGGLAKGHPNAEEIDGAVRFYQELAEQENAPKHA